MSKWQQVKLKDICTVTSSKRFHLSERTDIGIPFYCSKEIIKKESGEKITECDFIPTNIYNAIAEKYGVPQPGDILLTTRGSIGVPYLYKSGDCFYFADGNLTWLKNFNKLSLPHFLYYWFKSYIGFGKINAIAKGTAQKAVPIAEIKNIELELPPIEVQRKIADVLSAYDDLIENNRKQIKLLEEAAQRLYKEWFIDLRFPDYETTPIIDGIPEGWKRKKLIEIADITMGQSPNSEFYNSNRDGLPFHQGVGSFGTRFVIDETYSSSFSRVAESGDILFSVRAPVGRLNITLNKIAIGRGLAAIKQKNNLQSLLYYMLKEHFFKDDIIGNGSIFASITKDELTNFVLLVPRQDICEKFNTLTKDIDSKIMILDKQIRGIKETRDRLLPKLMTSELIETRNSLLTKLTNITFK